MRLRKLVAEDAATLVAIELAASRHPWSQKALQDSLANPTVSAWGIALEECDCKTTQPHRFGSIVGHCLMMQHEDWEILTIAIHPSFQRRGWGSKLLDYWLHHPKRQQATIFLEVAAGNSTAQAFYQALGFTTGGVRKGYYPATNKTPQEDALLLKHSTQNEA